MQFSPLQCHILNYSLHNWSFAFSNAESELKKSPPLFMTHTFRAFWLSHKQRSIFIGANLKEIHQKWTADHDKVEEGDGMAFKNDIQ